ncbi:hypothetical protein M5X04_11900 [Paenibacillus alvei]|uniref:Restriction endonuclease type IV Mrr domain-containing protein n=1 Tax=Paenibacillus alvei TaxID=44250 RepID=A0ABT4ECE0_PAEAL|nr:hypothetical protein [Paenibacillus alvei]MCY9530031.1 hypothetical protein [Paenibacillus alvei]
MGGRDTIKGVKAQGIVAVLESLSKADWKIVRIEPSTLGKKTDKIDIQWELNYGRFRIAQVKSTENPMTESIMKSYLNDLIQENFSSDYLYELHIIGPLHNKAREFVNNINKGTVETQELDGYESLKKRVSSSKIIVREFDFITLEALACKLLHEFYDRRNIVLRAKDIELRAKALLNDFDNLPIFYEGLSIERLNNKLMEWTDYFAVGYLDLSGRQELKESIERFKNDFKKMLGLFDFPNDILKERISRLNLNDAYSKALSIANVQNMYITIMSELENLEKKRELMLELKVNYDEAKKNLVSGDRRIPLSNQINQLSVEIGESIDNSELIHEFLAHLSKLEQEIYKV